MVIFNWWVGVMLSRAGWRSAGMRNGAQCVMSGGAWQTHKWPVVSSATHQVVRIMYCIIMHLLVHKMYICS